MKRAMGFGDFLVDWEGPIGLGFSLYRPHTQTARYQCKLEKRIFDLYLPLFLLKGNKKLPDKILIALGKSSNRMTTIGFHAETRPPQIKDDICEYDFCEEKGHSFLYVISANNQKYSLYVPKEIFQGEVPPKRLFIKIVPEECCQTDQGS